MHIKIFIGVLLALGLLTGGAPLTRGAETLEDEIGRTPPRLSLVDGQVSFWRPGAQDWVQAQINTPLAPGDQLYTGSPGTLELQIGSRAFVRAWASTQLGMENHEQDFLQFKVTAGRVSFDLRSVEPGHAVEVNTPNAAFTIEHPGYYCVTVTAERTSFITRRAGRATAIPASGERIAITASEEVLIEGVANPRIRSFAAPPLDDWDKWNYARTDDLMDAVSGRYVSPGTYGVDELDQHGTWRVVDPYGPVWVPTAVPSGWAPYSSGSWILDPFYGWSWVDTAPWGWAPYHHGRWVHMNGFWGWAPGPVMGRPVYAPALVAFFGGSGVSVGVSVGGPVLGWVALGWGEPCVPWWGRSGFIHRPWWGGWGGPRVVNDGVVHHTTVVDVRHITVYRNTRVRNAVTMVNEERFGRGRISPSRVAHGDMHNLRPLPTAPQVAKAAANFVPTTRRGIRPSEESRNRSVVATRPSHRSEDPNVGPGRRAEPGRDPAPAPRLVTSPSQREPTPVLTRPPFGQSPLERPMTDRRQSPSRQRPEDSRRDDRSSGEGLPSGARQVPAQPRQEVQAPGAAPTPTQPQPPARPATGAPAPAAGGQPAMPSSPEKAGRSERGPETRPSTTLQTPSQSKSAPQAAGPPSGPIQPPARPATGAPAPASRSEVTKPSSRPLPGEPASRLAPIRTERRPSQPVAQPATPQRESPNGKQGGPPREQRGK